MKATVVGTGYVGLVTGACLADAGNQVSCHDIDPERIARLRRGEIPIFEPGLEQVVARAVENDRLFFHVSLQAALEGSRVVLVAVGTPAKADGTADLRYLEAAIDDVAEHAAPDAVLVIRSTVPPGTGDATQARLTTAGRQDIQVVNAPEFLAEGTAVHDFQNPSRIVFGGPSRAVAAAAELWAPIAPEAPRRQVGRVTAELAKYAANTFLAARVSLINEMANLCDALGGNVQDLAAIVGQDDRIGPKFLRAGLGYGGSCFPKDVQALSAVARAAGVAVPVADAVQQTNGVQWQRALAALEAGLGDLAGKHIMIWGIAFKPGTDDTREAPALRLAAALDALGARVTMHDPVATTDRFDRATSAHPTAADAVVLATEWAEYTRLDWPAVAATMRGDLIVDGRNALPWGELQAAGLRVIGIGASP